MKTKVILAKDLKAGMTVWDDDPTQDGYITNKMTVVSTANDELLMRVDEADRGCYIENATGLCSFGSISEDPIDTWYIKA